MITATTTATTMENVALTVAFGENGARGHLALTTVAETELGRGNAVAKIRLPVQVLTKNEKNALMAAPKF